MDVTTYLTIIGAAVFGLGGFVLSGWIIRRLLRVIDSLVGELSHLAVRKPYYIIEVDDQGIRQIQALEDRIGIIEAEQNKPEPKIPAPFERAVKLATGGELPDMDDPDLVVVGERG